MQYTITAEEDIVLPTSDTASLRELQKLLSDVAMGIPPAMRDHVLKAWVNGKSTRHAAIRDLLLDPNWQSKILVDWSSFWGEMYIRLETVRIPECQPGYDRLLVVPIDLTLETAFRYCQFHFRCSKHHESKPLDDIVTYSQRSNARESYAIWVRESAEAGDVGEVFPKIVHPAPSATVMTLLERLIYEAKFFKETGRHLDLTHTTLCSGSRFIDGSIPTIYWNGNAGGMYVGAHMTSESDSRISPRRVIAIGG